MLEALVLDFGKSEKGWKRNLFCMHISSSFHKTPKLSDFNFDILNLSNPNALWQIYFFHLFLFTHKRTPSIYTFLHFLQYTARTSASPLSFFRFLIEIFGRQISSISFFTNISATNFTSNLLLNMLVHIHATSILANLLECSFSLERVTLRDRVERVSARREFRRVWTCALNLPLCVYELCKSRSEFEHLWKWHFDRKCNWALLVVREECAILRQMEWTRWNGCCSDFWNVAVETKWVCKCTEWKRKVNEWVWKRKEFEIEKFWFLKRLEDCKWK